MSDARAADRPVLEVRDLTVRFETQAGPVTAVQDVSFRIDRNEIVGLVGESGSGKSVTGMAIMGLLPRRAAAVTGSALLDGQELVGADHRTLQKLRGNRISMVFQDALTALDPVFTIERQLVETIRAHLGESKVDARKRAVKLLDDVGIPRAAERLSDYPHQLSGGMRQRVMIAIALACNPALVIADEPTTALDVTIQAQILDLLRDLGAEHGTSVLFVSHDLGVISELCSRVMTMYAGELIETGEIDGVLERPQHPYTSGLLQAIPRSGETGRLRSIPGRVPALDQLPTGCRFAPRCVHAVEQCHATHPVLDEAGSGRTVRCPRAAELNLPGALSFTSHTDVA